METQPTNTQALPPGTRIEEFVIERILGSGGFGITYLATDTALGRQVVIKENLPVQFCFRDTHSLTVAPRHTTGEDADNFQWSLENFSREAAMLASLDHPGIVRVLRSFQTFGTAYFVMPFVQGVAFDQLITQRQEKNQPFTEQELRGLLERMLDALGYLHDRGIYHRDIKPANLLITMEGIPTLIDFGSARQRLSERSMTVIESAGYTPFEQHQSRGNVGPWSDLYALAATLVKAITFETLPKAADRVLGDPWPGLVANSWIAVHYSSQFLSSIEKALAPLPEHRWQDAREWQDNLQTGIPMVGIAENTLPQPPVSDVATWKADDPATEKIIEAENLPVAPALWNPNTSAILSLILIPLVGVFLHARNARALGMPEDEKRNMWWFYGLALLIAVTMLLTGVSGLIKLYLLAYLVWYFTLGRKQERLVKAQFGKNYLRKNLFPPFLIGFGCLLAAVIFVEGLHSMAREEDDQSYSAEVASSGTVEETGEDLAISYYNRGVEYANGDGVPQNYEEAVKWYRKAAEMGQISAMNNLGACYADGLGVPKDIEEAAKWYRKAAEMGSSIAQRNLADSYLNGNGFAKDQTAAIGWFRKAAMQGDAYSQYMLGVSFSGVEGIPEDLPEAVKWYQKSADQGNAEAQYLLADSYLNGNGVTKDPTIAVKWLRKAAEQNFESAQNLLGDCYKDGLGVTTNLSEAAKWYRLAAEQGYANAQYKLALAYITGSGVAEDASKAFEWFQKAANQDLMASQYFLGVLYQSGEGETKDTTKALEWLTKAASQGYPDAQYELGNLYSNGLEVKIDHIESVKWYRAAADQGHANSQTNLGVAYANGEGVPEDLVSAYMWTHLAAISGEEQAKKNLDIFAGAMTGQQVTDALRQAVEWTTKHREEH